MLQLSPNENNFDIYSTTNVTSGVIYNLMSFDITNRTGIWTNSGITHVDLNSEFDLLFICLDQSTKLLAEWRIQLRNLTIPVQYKKISEVL